MAQEDKVAVSYMYRGEMEHGMDANRARIDLARSFGLGMKDGALEGSRKLSWRKDYGALDRISDLAEELGIDMPGDDDER